MSENFDFDMFMSTVTALQNAMFIMANSINAKLFNDESEYNAVSVVEMNVAELNDLFEDVSDDKRVINDKFSKDEILDLLRCTIAMKRLAEEDTNNVNE